MKNHKIKTAVAISSALCLVIAAVLAVRCGEETKAQERQQAIAGRIIRLHVIANSDSEEDQELKLKVKEAIVEELRESMQDARNVEEARRLIAGKLSEIETVAAEKMREEGYSYTAEAVLGESYFPVKQYGDLVFPAGNYEALRVRLGKSEGRNWWCVMYPTLCFVDSTYQIVPEDSKERLKTSLTEEEYNSLLDGGGDVSYSWKIVEWIQNLV